MNKRITLRDIAKATGYHYSTISLALRNDPEIAVETRVEIHGVAERMGYSPDPLARALSIYRASTRPISYHATLAWISIEEGSLRNPEYIFRGFSEGAMKRASELGYKIEEFSFQTPGITLENLPRILQSRGINGILVPPRGPRDVDKEIRMDWSRFPAVAFGYSLHWPQLHLVANCHHRSIRTSVRKLVGLGHRRIGLLFNKWSNIRVDCNWTGGYFAEMHQQNLEPFAFTLESTSPFETLEKKEVPLVKAWLKKHRLEALIVDYSPPLILWLRTVCRLRIPEDISVVSLNVESDNAYHTGIDQNHGESGHAAVDFLVNLIHTNDRGIPAIPRRLLIEGSWREGKTVAVRGEGRQDQISKFPN